MGDRRREAGRRQARRMRGERPRVQTVAEGKPDDDQSTFARPLLDVDCRQPAGKRNDSDRAEGWPQAPAGCEYPIAGRAERSLRHASDGGGPEDRDDEAENEPAEGQRGAQTGARLHPASISGRFPRGSLQKSQRPASLHVLGLW